MTLNIPSALVDLFPPDKQLNSEQLASALTDNGLKTSTDTLAAKACHGDGPPYQLYGRIRIYVWWRVVAWLNDKLGEPASSATEHRIRARSKRVPTEHRIRARSTRVSRAEEARDNQ